jgi:aspartyl-tRNA(Asn)/glutamyl-tRNA(Gln) amidotransferase subunit B
MDEGSFRADINISVKKKDAQELGTRVEVKNMNSIKFITQAINYEIERQIQTLEEGETFTQQTRLWDSKNNKTIFMRTKESGDDYRYFNEPDLPVLIIDQNWVDKLRKHVPELPDQKLKRLQNDYGLSLYEAEIFMINRKLADFLEQTMKHCKNAKTASNVILRDVLKFLKDEKITLAESNITPEHLGELVNALDKGTINSKVGQEVFASMASNGTSPNKFIEDNDLKQIDSADQIEPIIAKILADNPDNVAKYKGGNERVLPFFVGQVMKATKGKANPKIINELLKKHLS